MVFVDAQRYRSVSIMFNVEWIKTILEKYNVLHKRKEIKTSFHYAF